MDLRTSSFILVFLVMIPCVVLGQAMVNPDISAIADMRYLYRDDVAAKLTARNNASFEFEELELAFTGYLNPYMRADFYLGIHGVTGPFELEEGYASVVRGMPVQLKFGKYLLDFGKLNTEHPHQWGWLERPLMHRTAFGDEGASVIGLGASRLLALGENAVTLSLSGFRGDLFEVASLVDNGHDDEHAHDLQGAADIGSSGRLSVFRSLTDDAHIELGGSGLFARYDHEHGLDAWLAGGDFKFRWRPDTYRSFNWISEALYGDREVENLENETLETVTAWGAFSAAELQFRKRFDVGLYFDWAQDAFVQDSETTAYGGYVGFMPVEETARFNVVYRYEESDSFEGSSNTVTLQVLWSLGPHKPHPF